MLCLWHLLKSSLPSIHNADARQEKERKEERKRKEGGKERERMLGKVWGLPKSQSRLSIFFVSPDLLSGLDSKDTVGNETVDDQTYSESNHVVDVIHRQAVNRQCLLARCE